jgi:hypothetical protein
MRESHRRICNSWERGTESEANAPEEKRPNPHLTVMVEKPSAAHLSATAQEWIAPYSEIVKNGG